MKRLVILSIIFVVILAILLISYVLSKRQAPPSSITPTPTSLPTVPMARLHVISTNPQNGATGVSPSDEITVSFNKPIQKEDIVLAIAPTTLYTTRIEGSKLIITPQTVWDAGMPYRYTIKYIESAIFPESFTFTVIGPTPLVLPDTGPSDEDIKNYEENERAKYPDVFLAGKTPFEGTSFSVTSDFTSTPSDHYYFTTTLRGDAGLAKQELNSWLVKLGFTDAQIIALDIRYQ